MKTLAPMLDALEAAYRLDLDGDAYVRNLVDIAAPLMDDGLGVLAYTYDATSPLGPAIDHSATSARLDPEEVQRFYVEVAAAGHTDRAENPEPTGFDSWGHMRCGQASAVRGMEPFLPYFRILGGSRDAFAVNALDTSGRGLWIGAPLRTTRKVSRDKIELFTRFAGHLTSAVRLRTRARGGSATPAAVLSPGDGALLDATQDSGVVEARELLRDATRSFDVARTKALRGNADAATRRWRPLVVARWSLLDEFDSDGRRFVVAVENAPATGDKPRALSEREYQVMTQARLGYENKVIAYELGLSSSTVRVLMHRAAAKLGATTRLEAVARFTALVGSAAR